MDKDALLGLLGLKPQDVAHQAHQPIQASQAKAQPTSEPISLWALQLDSFDQAQGSKLIRHSHQLRETGLEPEAVSDFFSLGFLTSPQAVEKCKDERRLEFVQGTLSSPDYLALHRGTELNPVASELTCIELSQSFSKLRKQDKEQQEKLEQRQQRGQKVNGEREALKQELACQRAVLQALQAAEKEVESYQETMAALGCGPGAGGNEKMDVGKIAQLFQKTKDDPLLRRVMELAGRYRRAAQAKQRQKTSHGRDDVVGVVLDGDVGRLVPSELAQLVVEELELDALRRLAERQSMCRDYRGVEKVGRGPIVVCVDESGSMDGEPLAQAKAFALAMAWVARHQNRWCCLCGYSGGTDGTRLVLPPNKWDESALLEWLAHDFSGGTSMDVPLDKLPQEWWPAFVAQGMRRGKSDLILITDAIVRLPKTIEESFQAWKKREQARCLTLVLGAAAGDLGKVSDEVFCMEDLALGQGAIQRCFAV